MSSEVDICNLALSLLGDTANVSSLSELSFQAQLCTRFYPIARDSLLEMHTWGFATKRVVLAEVENTWPQWQHAYACPNDALNLLGVLPPLSRNDYIRTPDGRVETQPFVNETDTSGAPILLTNQADATLRYTAAIVDASQFSPLFTTALAWHLASMLAGPILKGDVGSQQALRCEQAMQGILAKAVESDSNQRRVTPEHVPTWMGARGLRRRADGPDAHGWGD